MNILFDLIAPFYERLRPRAREVFRTLNRLVEFKQSDIVVDIGGGTGVVARFFVEGVQRIIVIDPSEKMLEQCQKHQGVSCILGTAERLPLTDGSIDKVVLVDAFHHIPRQEEAVREIKRVLRPGGTALLVEYNPATFGGKLIVLLEAFLRMGSMFHTPRVLTHLFEMHGFSVSLHDEEKTEYILVARRK